VDSLKLYKDFGEDIDLMICFLCFIEAGSGSGDEGKANQPKKIPIWTHEFVCLLLIKSLCTCLHFPTNDAHKHALTFSQPVSSQLLSSTSRPLKLRFNYAHSCIVQRNKIITLFPQSAMSD